MAKDTFADTYAGQRQPKYVARYFNMTQKRGGRGAWLDSEQANRQAERERWREWEGVGGRGVAKVNLKLNCNLWLNLFLSRTRRLR